MKAIFRKLKSKAGESLVESLAAILIFTMASIVMYTMVTTAGDINTKAKELDARNQVEIIAVEMGNSSYKNGTAEVTFKIGSNTIAEVDVDIYGGQTVTEDGTERTRLFTYFMSTGG